ncbi:MAG: 4Fe-4S binding protein [Nitrosomonadales bacterium]|nr:4Fe-4S binding protein [Nitrosomonadales bacterium]
MSTRQYHNQRRLVQILSLAVFILIPAFGLFRIDVDTGDFTILNRQVWWSDYFLMLGSTVMLIAAGVMSYSTIGAIWCGWACPQNTVSEWANNLTRRMLGKRADVSVAGEGMTVAADKNKFVNWLVLAVSFLGISLVTGIVPLFYFYPPEQVWALITFTLDPKLSEFMSLLYLVFVVGVFLDIAVIRYFWCDYACLYRLGYRLFRNKDALHIQYDESRSGECAKCNYCATSCIIGIDPRKFTNADTCINCAECVDACTRLHDRKGGELPGLLKYESSQQRPTSMLGRMMALARRFNWVGVIFIVGTALFVWGLHKYQPYDIVAYRAERATAASVSDYRVRISNKLYTPAELTLSVSGLPEGSYQLDADHLSLGPAERASVNLRISRDLPKGLHRVDIRARAADGWEGHFEVTHFTASK